MADSKEQQAMRVDTALVKELAELLSANELTEIEVEDNGRKIKVKRDAAPVMAYAQAPAVAAAPASAASAASLTADAAPAAAQRPGGGGSVADSARVHRRLRVDDRPGRGVGPAGAAAGR